MNLRIGLPVPYIKDIIKVAYIWMMYTSICTCMYFQMKVTIINSQFTIQVDCKVSEI